MTPEIDPTVLRGDRDLLGRSSTADRVAELLRTHIAEGHLLPGARLPEDAIGQALGVSRNTLREAFRLLTHEKLLSHALNRGVFVRTSPSRTSSTSTRCADSSSARRYAASVCRRTT